MRQVIELRDLRELSVRETALITGLSIAAVKARLFHARRQLREALRRNIRSAKGSAQRFAWESSASKNVPRDPLAYDHAEISWPGIGSVFSRSALRILNCGLPCPSRPDHQSSSIHDN
jgi:hypothetical protein